MRPLRLASLTSLLALSACDPMTSPADAGVDAFRDESSLDGGPRSDVGMDAPDAIIDESSEDGGPRSDAGVDAPMVDDAGHDAGAIIFEDVLASLDAGSDAFVEPDAFVTPDAFVSPDAFTPPDAFVPADAFTPPDAFRRYPLCSAPDLAVPSSPTPPALVISEIDPGTFIEIYNTTSADLPLTGTAYQLCSPFVYASLASLGPTVTVPAHGYAMLPWPGGFADTEAGGEVSLYTSGAFGDPAAVMSFVCWGTNPHGTRKTTAEMGGRWSGACAGAITAGRSIARRPGNTGSTAAHYATDATPSPETCGP